MKQLYLITKREYLTRIKKKSFIILTLLMPFLFVALLFVPYLLSQIKDSETKEILVIDNSGSENYSSILKSFDHYVFTPQIQQNIDVDYKSDFKNGLFGVLQVSGDLKDKGNTVTFVSEKQPPADLILYLNQTFSEKIKSEKVNELVEQTGIDHAVVGKIQSVLEDSEGINISTIRWSNGEEKESSTEISVIIGAVLTFIMYMFILTYGSMVMQGVVEEKSNRIVEVMISSVKPFDLMMGKIIGVGLTGITQLGLWTIIISVILSLGSLFGGASFTAMGNSEQIQNLDLLFKINWVEIILFFFLLFIGGYLIYASIFAMFGAAVDNAQDSQQFVLPITILFMFAFYAGIYSLQNPDGPLSFWCSIIPLTSPVVMMVRVPFEIPLWEKLLSVFLLYGTSIFIILIASKIYRVGILMYGKKPTFKEIFKWISYK